MANVRLMRIIPFLFILVLGCSTNKNSFEKTNIGRTFNTYDRQLIGTWVSQEKPVYKLNFSNTNQLICTIPVSKKYKMELLFTTYKGILSTSIVGSIRQRTQYKISGNILTTRANLIDQSKEVTTYIKLED